MKSQLTFISAIDHPWLRAGERRAFFKENQQLAKVIFAIATFTTLCSHVMAQEKSMGYNNTGKNDKNLQKMETVNETHMKIAINEKIEIGLLIDLSHTIEHGLVTYKGLPAPIICDYLSRENSKNFYAEGTEFQIGKIEMVANTGTYIDCPFHRFEEGKDLSEIGLESLVDLNAVMLSIPFSETLEITEEHLKKYKIKNKAVLIHTGWANNWNTEKYYENHPYLTEGAANYLKDSGVRLVGIDSHNIDSTVGKTRPVHTTLLDAEILIVEHLCNLHLLPKDGFTFSAIPPKFKGVGTFPVRAMAKLIKKSSR